MPVLKTFTNEQDKCWRDYGALFRTRASRYRLICNIMINVFGQWTGNTLLGILLSAVLETAGIKSQRYQTNLNLGLACLQLVMATAGSFMVDKLGRRPLLILSNAGLAIIWIGMTIVTAYYENSYSTGFARAIVAFIILFDIIFAIGITPLQVLYTVEVLTYETRAKGVAFGGLAVNVAALVNDFAWPIAIAKIGWKTYIVSASWCVLQATLIYFFIPETGNCTVSTVNLRSPSSSRTDVNFSLKNSTIYLDQIILAKPP